MIGTKLSEIMTAEDYCAKRDEIVMLVTKAVDALGQADSLLKTMANYGFSFDRYSFYGIGDEGKRIDSINQLTKQADKKIWDSIVEIGKFRELMTVNEQRKISEQLEKCPPVTLETVKATFATLKANRPNMLQDLVSTAFIERDKKFKTNGGMGISKKQIINNVFCKYGYTSWGSRACDRLEDICKAIAMVSGCEKPNITQILQRSSEHVDFNGAVRFKAFQNGNVHLWIEDKHIIDRLNDILSGAMGAKVGNI